MTLYDLVNSIALQGNMEDEIRDPATKDSRREVLRQSIPKWEDLHDKLRRQLDEFDNAHPVEDLT